MKHILLQKKSAMILSLILISLLCIYMIYNSRDKKPIRLRIEEEIKAALPIGSDFQDVQSYLDKSKIPYQWDEEGNYFSAFVRDVAYRWPFTESLSIDFYLDGNKKLQRIEFESSLTGP